MNNQVQQVMNNLNDEQKDQLLQAFITNEFFKKTNEINKNYKDENKRAFAHSNIENALMDRLVKKLSESQSKQEIASQVETLESLL